MATTHSVFRAPYPKDHHHTLQFRPHSDYDRKPALQSHHQHSVVSLHYSQQQQQQQQQEQHQQQQLSQTMRKQQSPEPYTRLRYRQQEQFSSESINSNDPYRNQHRQVSYNPDYGWDEEKQVVLDQCQMHNHQLQQQQRERERRAIMDHSQSRHQYYPQTLNDDGSMVHRSQKTSYYFATGQDRTQRVAKHTLSSAYSPPPLTASSSSSSPPSPKSHPLSTRSGPHFNVGSSVRDPLDHRATYPSHQHKHPGKLRHSPLLLGYEPRYHLGTRGPTPVIVADDEDSWHPPSPSPSLYYQDPSQRHGSKDIRSADDKNDSSKAKTSMSVSPLLAQTAAIVTTSTAARASTHSPSIASQRHFSSSSSTSSTSPSISYEPVTPILTFGQRPHHAHHQASHHNGYDHYSSNMGTNRPRHDEIVQYSDNEVMDEPHMNRYHYQYRSSRHRNSNELSLNTSYHTSAASMSMEDVRPISGKQSPLPSPSNNQESSNVPSLSFTSTSISVAGAAVSLTPASTSQTATMAFISSGESTTGLSFKKGSTATEEIRHQIFHPRSPHHDSTSAMVQEAQKSSQLPYQDNMQPNCTTKATQQQQHPQQANTPIRFSSGHNHDRKRVKQGMRYSCLVPECRLLFQNKSQLDSHIWVCREVNKNKIAKDSDVVMTMADSQEGSDVNQMRSNNNTLSTLNNNRIKSTASRVGRASSFAEDTKNGDDNSESSSGDARVYPCPEPDCKAIYTSLESLARHRYRHAIITTGGKLPCTWPGCDKTLATTKSLKDHLQIHAEREAGIQLECPVPGCGKIFGTHRCLRAHELRCKQVKSGERLPCPIEGCKATFGSTDYVRRHVLDHEKGLIGVEFRCDFAGCKAILANPLTLQRHKQLHEEQALGFEWKCLVTGCGKVYSGSKQLTDHQSRIHKDLSPLHQFACPYNTCKELFDCQRSAYKHGCLNERPPKPPLPSTTTENIPAGSAAEINDASIPTSVLAPPVASRSVSSANIRPSLSKIRCSVEGCHCEMFPEQLESHLWMHKTLRTRPPYPCFEEGCSLVFESKQEILFHSLTHDDSY